MSESQSVILCLYYNSESTASLVISELQSVIEVANILPDNTHFLWDVSNDRTLTYGAVTLHLLQQ